MSAWEPIIGLEIHVQLDTRTKMFCACDNRFGAEPNTLTCPLCLGHPGVLPVINEAAVDKALAIGLALNCEIPERSRFHRKNYFYPDSPKAYQISQYDEPICGPGHLDVEGGRVGIVRAHLEEDAAKLVHAGGAGGRIAGAESSVVDFNRCGTPLVEIVTEPDLRSPEQAIAFLALLKNTLQTIGVSDCDMEKGSLRCDANVSVRRRGDSALGTKTELKNMNSFKFLAEGMAAEIERQKQLLDGGGTVEQETLHYDPAQRRLHARRSKEEADDYRYFPEPDLVPVEPPAELVARLRGELLELPAERISRVAGTLDHDRALVLVTGGLDSLWQATVDAGAEPVAASNVIANQLVAAGVDASTVDAGELARLVEARERIPRGAFTEAMAKVGDAGFSADPYLAQEAVSDTSALEPIVDAVLAANPAQVEQYRGGKDGLLGFFVGQVMKETTGQADPRSVNDLVRAKLAR